VADLAEADDVAAPVEAAAVPKVISMRPRPCRWVAPAWSGSRAEGQARQGRPPEGNTEGKEKVGERVERQHMQWLAVDKATCG